jgi:ketosteroid isomerase-like protein
MSAVEGGSFRGAKGFREFYEEWDRTWESWHVDPESVDEIGDQVLVLGQVHAKGRGSGLELDQPVGYLFEFRDGLLAKGATFFDHDQARRAAGIQEDVS